MAGKRRVPAGTGRRKTTVYLGDEEMEAVEKLSMRWGHRTMASTIRHALRAQLKQIEELPPDTTRLGIQILKWAETLQFKNDREHRELLDLTFQMYELVGKEATKG